MSDSPDQPGWAFKAVNGKTLESFNWMNRKLNVLPGFHLLFCAIGASVLGGSTKLALDWLGGETELTGTLGRVLGASKPGPLHSLHGKLKVDHTHMPRTEDWDKFSPDTLSQLAKNDWTRNLHHYLPSLAAVFGIILGSKLFFESHGIPQKVEEDAQKYQNILTDQRQVQLAQSQANGVLSGMLSGGTGGGSVRATAGYEMTLGRFLPGVGDFNGIPGLRRVLHGKGISGEFNSAGLKILERDLVPYLATAKDEQLDRSYIKRAVKGIIGPLFEQYTEQDVEGLTDGLIGIRNNMLEAQAGDKTSLIDVMGDAILKGWDGFLSQNSYLNPADAHIEGHGGLLPAMARALGRIPLIGGGKHTTLEAIHRESAARYDRQAA